MKLNRINRFFVIFMISIMCFTNIFSNSGYFVIAEDYTMNESEKFRNSTSFENSENVQKPSEEKKNHSSDNLSRLENNLNVQSSSDEAEDDVQENNPRIGSYQAIIDGKVWNQSDGDNFLKNWQYKVWQGYNGTTFFVLDYYKGTDKDIVIPGYIPSSGGSRYVLIRSGNPTSSDYFLRKANGNTVGLKEINSIRFVNSTLPNNHVASVGFWVGQSSLQGMFQGATNLKSADLRGLLTENSPNYKNYSTITNFSHMFENCSSLSNVYLMPSSHLKLATDTSYMFNGCTNLSAINNIGSETNNFNTPKVTNMSYMFAGTKISNPPSISYDSVTNLSHMFEGCTNLAKMTDNILANKAVDASYIFSNCTKLTNVSVIQSSNITNLSYAYRNCTGLTTTYNGNISNILGHPINTVTNMSHMFEGCTSLSEQIDFRWYNLSSVADMSYMFSGCTSLSDPLVTRFTTSNVKNMSGMFKGCTSLNNNFLSSNKINTASATDLSSMFSGCTGLTNITPQFNTSNVTNMSYMFYDCRNLQNANLTSFSTSNVTDMSYMFSGTYNLTNINVSTFDTSKVNSMLFMFGYTNKLRYIDLSNFKINSHASLVKLFYTSSPTPLLVVAGATNGNSLYNYNYNSDNRVPVDTPRLDANGGNWGNNKTTMNYFDRICIYSNDSKLNMATFNKWLNANHPSKSGTAFVRWTANNNASTIENMVKTGTVYQAEWMLVPNTSNENRKTGSLGILSIAYVPNSFSTGQSGIDLNNSSEQHIPFVGNNSMSVGVRDQQMKKSTWKLNARLNWNGKSPNGGAYIKIGESSYISQNVNNGSTVYNPTTDLKSIQNVIVENNKIISTSDSTIISNNGNALNGVYDYNLGNISFVLSDSKQVGIGNYGATVTWNLSTTP